MTNSKHLTLDGTEQVTDTTLAKLAGVSARRIRQLSETGILERATRGRYALGPSLQALIDNAADTASELQRARTRLVQAQADIAETEARERMGEVVRLDVLTENLSDLFAIIKTNLRNVPNRLSASIVGETDERRIKTEMLREIDECLVTLAELNFQPKGATEDDEQE